MGNITHLGTFRPKNRGFDSRALFRKKQGEVPGHLEKVAPTPLTAKKKKAENRKKKSYFQKRDIFWLVGDIWSRDCRKKRGSKKTKKKRGGLRG